MCDISLIIEMITYFRQNEYMRGVIRSKPFHLVSFGVISFFLTKPLFRIDGVLYEKYLL